MKIRILLIGLIVVVVAGIVVYRGLFGASRESGEPKPPADSTVTVETGPSTPTKTPVRRSDGKPVPEAPRTTPPDGQGVIEGQVLLPDGHPAAQAAVQVRYREARETEGPLTTEADADGRFLLERLEWGWYGLYASQGERAATTVCRLTSHKPAADLTLVLEPGGFISGHVLGDGGAGVASAVVVPAVHDEKRVQAGQHETLTVTTAENGSFVSPLLPERAWQFEVQADGYATTVSPAITVGTSDARIYLERGGMLSGVVVEVDSENPVPNMALSAKNPDAPARSRETETNEAGEFAFTGLVNGANRIASSDPERVLVPAVSTFDVGRDSASEEVVLYAAKGATVAGTVLDASGGPVTGMSVYAEASDTSTMMSGQSSPSDQSGGYRITGLAPGTYTLAINELSHLQIQHQSVTLEQGETRSGVDFVLPFGISVSGHVYDVAGAPAPGAEIEGRFLTGPFGQGRVHAVADGEGAFRIFGPESESELFLRATTGRASSAWYGPIIVSAEGMHDVELILDEVYDGVVAGIVVSETGQPLRSVLGVDDLAGEDLFSSTKHVVTGWDGTFVVPVHTPGEYEIFLGPYDPNGYLNATVSVARISLDPGQSRRGLRLTYSEQGLSVIAGRVIDADGKPISGAMVNPAVLQGTSDTPLSVAHSDDAGEFTLEMPEEGVYRLIVVAPGYAVEQVYDVATGTRDLTIILTKKSQIHGRVIDSSTGHPVPSFSVAVVPTGMFNVSATRFQSFNDGSGSFSVDIPGTSGSNYEVVVKADGYQEMRTAIDSARQEAGSSPYVISVSPMR